MSTKDKNAIKKLHALNYIVVVANVDGKTFPSRYRVFQAAGWEKLKAVVVDFNGSPVALQG